MAKFNTGQSFADGDQVTGAKLNNIVGLLDIYSGVIADQTASAATVAAGQLALSSRSRRCIGGHVSFCIKSFNRFRVNARSVFTCKPRCCCYGC